VRETGGLGLVIITAPLPAEEMTELLTIFVATTVTQTLEPQGRLKGGDYKAEIGIVQLRSEIFCA